MVSAFPVPMLLISVPATHSLTLCCVSTEVPKCQQLHCAYLWPSCGKLEKAANRVRVQSCVLPFLRQNSALLTFLDCSFHADTPAAIPLFQEVFLLLSQR